MSDLVVDASPALQWFFEDETDRKYSLGVLASLSEKRALVPLLWFYEVGNGLLMAFRRNRITVDQIQAFLTRLKSLPINAAQQTPAEILELPSFARIHGLTNYDAAYLALAGRSAIPLATTDQHCVLPPFPQAWASLRRDVRALSCARYHARGKYKDREACRCHFSS